MEVTSASRRNRCSRACCSGSPSTRQLCKEPRLGRGTPLESSDITHLRQEYGSLTGKAGRRRPPPIRQQAGRPSQDVRFARVLMGLDTGCKDKFPRPPYGNGGVECKDFRRILTRNPSRKSFLIDLAGVRMPPGWKPFGT